MPTDPKFKLFDIVKFEGHYAEDFGIIVTDRFKLHYYHDGVASESCKVPLDFTNIPKEFEDHVDGYMIFFPLKDEQKFVAEHNIHCVLDLPAFMFDVAGHVPFDFGTSKLRNILGLIALAYTIWGNEDGFEKFMRSMQPKLDQ